jgi:hypothetical protein
MYKNHDTHDDGAYCISLTFFLPLNNTDMCKLTQHIHRVPFCCVSGHEEAHVFSNSKPVYSINPYPANVENMVSVLIMPANGRLDLTWHLKG